MDFAFLKCFINRRNIANVLLNLLEFQFFFKISSITFINRNLLCIYCFIQNPSTHSTLHNSDISWYTFCVSTLIPNIYYVRIINYTFIFEKTKDNMCF